MDEKLIRELNEAKAKAWDDLNINKLKGWAV